MITALFCAYKSGDVIGLALAQLIESDAVTRILVADGPHRGPVKPGHKADKPSVYDVVRKFRSKKTVYEYTDDQPTRADKNNRILRHISRDCQWLLNVDSDEVYHEEGLKRLVAYLKDARYGRYCVHSINPYPDFRHQFTIPDWKPRVYRWFPGACCEKKHDRHHQYVLHPNQRACKGQERMGMARLPTTVCELWHLNALRAPLSDTRRVTPKPDGTVVWRGGKKALVVPIRPLDIRKAPRSIRALGRDTL